MSIIKNAFDEGRTTKVSWDKSKAKKAEIKMEVALDNINAPKRNSMAPISLEMIDPNTGKALAYFPSRLAAATYIVNNILKRPEKNPLSVTGNLEICMKAGWKSYGYYWKISDKPIKNDMTGFDISEGIVLYKNNKKSATYYSYSEVAKVIGIDRSVLRKRILRGSPIDTTGVYTYVRNPVVKPKGYKAKAPNATANTGWAKRSKK